MVSYLLLADAHACVCRSRADLAARLVWAREHGYVSAKARPANGVLDRPLLLPSERARLVEEATKLALGQPGYSRAASYPATGSLRKDRV